MATSPMTSTRGKGLGRRYGLRLTSPVHPPVCSARAVACSSRRAVLFGFAFSCALAPPVLAADPASLPKDFIDLERKLISTLKESIETELEGRSESEVRRSAEAAKAPIREFIGKWKLDGRVQGDLVFTETAQALEELGQYYLKRGQRAALDSSTANSVLRHLRAAEVKLPEKEDKKFLGIF